MAFLTAPPVFTQTVNQQFFIEALGGGRPPINYLDRFPDTIYSKGLDTVLAIFLYTLMGPAGGGRLRQEYLAARLELEEAGLSTVHLDALYTSPFAFARLAEETYDIDASASLISSEDRATILASDAAFRNRCITFLKGVRAGGTPLGIELSAESGLNHAVDVIENYQALYDQFTDFPLNLPFYGSTTSTNEVVILPRQEVPRSSRQSISIDSIAASGNFTLSYPVGPDFNVVAVNTTSGSNSISMPSTSLCAAGGYISITPVPTSASLNNTLPSIFAQIQRVVSSTTITVVYPPGATNAGSAYNMPNTGSYWAYCGYGQTSYIPYNATSHDVQVALAGLPILSNNTVVTGGPLPQSPIFITFIQALADTEVATLQVNLDQDYITGVGIPGGALQVADILGNYFTDANASVTNDIVGTSADGQNSPIAPIDMHAMQTAVDKIRPVTSFVTTQIGQSTTKRQPTNQIFAGSNYTEVLRFETGRSLVPWQTTDDVHWIEPAQEVEAPKPLGHRQSTYAGFHNIGNIISYSENALAANDYNDPDPSLPPLYVRFWNTMIGTFSPGQVALYPILGNHTDPNYQFSTAFASAVSPDPLVLTTTVDGIGIINDNYPVDYLGLPNVPQFPTQQVFWSSSERIDGVDFLEIDLGTPQAVNYIYFEAITKPIEIDVAYDTLDLTPQRRFIPVNIMPPTLVPSTTSLTYSASSTNPWDICELNFTNALGQMIFTRYIRIGFRRVPGHTPLQITDSRIIPYSVEVRNLRVGRRLNPDSSIPVNTTGGAPSVGLEKSTIILEPGVVLNSQTILAPATIASN